MSANLSAEVVLKWGDGEYLFALKGKQLEYLEKVCGAGIQEIAERLFNRKAKYIDIRETVQQGLIGGGMPAVTASEKMKVYFDGLPLAALGDPSSPLATAQSIWSAVFFGMEDIAEPGEGRAGESPAANSTSQSGEQSSSSEE